VISFRQGSTERARFDSNGYFGIGTSSPTGFISIRTGLSGVNLDIANQASGSIDIGNASPSAAVPFLTGKSTDSTGLFLSSATSDANPSADMRFSVREDNSTDFSTLAGKTAFLWTRFTTALGSVSREGEWEFGTGSTSGTLKNTMTGAFEIAYNNTASGNNSTLEVTRPTSATASDVITVRTNVGGTDLLKWRVECDGDTISATGSYTSDERAKKLIRTIPYGLAEIMLLNPSGFRWKYEADSDIESYSVGTAQTIESIMPEMVRDDGLDDGEGGTYKAVYDKEISAVMVKAIQELKTEKDAEIAARDAIIAALDARITALENP
jgi:hypothetical protein